MKQEDKDKELLFRYLSMALPYGVKAKVWGWDEEKGEVEVPLRIYSINADGYIHFEANKYDIDYLPVEECCLYLRPMFWMTEEERKEYQGFIIHREYVNAWGQEWYIDCLSLDNSLRLIDWLLKKHFDFMGLIPRGLAIKVTEETYGYNS